MNVLLDTTVDLPFFGRGKVRDTYDLGDELLIVTTDRISAFDVVLPNGIPDKGLVLTQLSAFFFERTTDEVPHHFIRVIDNTRLDEIDLDLPQELIGRSMLVKKAQQLPVECIVRGYLTGSGWAEYKKSGTVCGLHLPRGLQESQQLPEPIFTPSTKADEGHDENITFQQMADIVGSETAEVLRRYSLSLYQHGRDHARKCGIIIADTKFEFGRLDGKLILIDEALTPDSSRFWPADQYEVGRSQPSFDKQFVRDWLAKSGWNKEPPAPTLPSAIVERTADKYRQAFHLLTGRALLHP